MVKLVARANIRITFGFHPTSAPEMAKREAGACRSRTGKGSQPGLGISGPVRYSIRARVPSDRVSSAQDNLSQSRNREPDIRDKCQVNAAGRPGGRSHQVERPPMWMRRALAAKNHSRRRSDSSDNSDAERIPHDPARRNRSLTRPPSISDQNDANTHSLSCGTRQAKAPK